MWPSEHLTTVAYTRHNNTAPDHATTTLGYNCLLLKLAHESEVIQHLQRQYRFAQRELTTKLNFLTIVFNALTT